MSDQPQTTKGKEDRESPLVARLIIFGILAVLLGMYFYDIYSR